MKPFSFIVILVLGIVISGMMWQDPFLSIEDQGRPVIKFETTTLDLGEISYGSEGSCWFVLKNTGKSPLIITSVMTTCDCSASSWPKKPVYPDQTDSIGVIYNTHNSGFFSKTLDVHSNAKNSPTVLTIKGRIVKEP